MSEEQWKAVDGYLSEQLVASDEVLDAALEASAAAGLPAISVAPTHGKLLHLFARLVNAQRILEIGTLGGYSTIWLARALPAGGRLVTLELRERYSELARTNVERAGLGDLVEFLVGPALESLRLLGEERVEPFDFVFIDADKRSTPEYFEASLLLTRPGGVIVVDNVVRDGALADAAAEDPGVQGMRRFHELLASEPRAQATTIQTVGGKGYDGFTLVLLDEQIGSRDGA
jgi:predicted O-methyltransferase YrrM